MVIMTLTEMTLTMTKVANLSGTRSNINHLRLGTEIAQIDKPKQGGDQH